MRCWRWIAIVALVAFWPAGPLPGASAEAQGGDRALPGASAQAQSGDPAEVRRYAESLSQSRQFHRAAVEFLRYSLSLPDSAVPEREGAWLEAAVCFRRAGRPDAALRELDLLDRWSPLSEEGRCRSRVVRAHSLFDLGEYPALAGGASDSLEACPSLKTDLAILRTGSALHLAEWTLASSIANATPRAASEQSKSAALDALSGLAERGQRMRRPSPAAAAILSAIVPGAGRIYAGRTAEGVYSFLLNAFGIWQTAAAFREDGSSSARAWITGAGTLLLYSGNIYGSALAAERARSSSFEALSKDADQIVDWSVSW